MDPSFHHIHWIRSTAPSDHVISLQNLSAEGISGIQFVDNTNTTRSSIGWSNVASIHPSTMRMESDSGIVFSNTEDATSVSTGSLRIKGGVGVAKSLHLGGSLHVTGPTFFTGTVTVPNPTSEFHATTKSYVDNSNVNFTVGDGLVKTDSVISMNPNQSTVVSLGTLTGLTSSGVVVVTNTASSTSVTTGALRVSGGVGIQGSLFLGTQLNVTGTTTFSGTVTVPIPTATTHATTKAYVDGATYLTAGTGLTRTGSIFSVDANQSQITSLGTLTALNCSGIVTFTETSQSTSAATGAVRIHGGVGVQKDLHVGANISASNLGALAFKDVVDWGTDITDRPLDLTDQIATSPPEPMTDNTTSLTLEGDQSFLSGDYIASASSESIPAWNAFDANKSSVSSSWTSNYNYSSGSYTGNISTIANTGTHLGEWLQLELPLSARVSDIEFHNGSSDWAPKDVTILGSTDGSIWMHLASMTFPSLSHQTLIEDIPSTSSSRFIRLVVHSTQSSTSSSPARVQYLRYHIKFTLGSLATKDVVDWNTDVINRPTIQDPRNAGTGLTLDTNANTLSVNAVQNQITAVGTLTGLTSSGVVSVTNSTASTSVTTGALRVTGGVGIQGSLFVGNQLNVIGTTTLTGAVTVTVPTPTANTHATTKGYVDGASYLTAGTGLSRSGGTFSVDAAQSQITSVGTLTGLTSSGAVVISNSTNSTSTSTGALRVTGGTGIQGTLFVGGNVNVAGTTTLTGAVTVPNPTANAHATTKSYVDGATYLTAGTGLTQTGSTFSVNASQSQITTLGTLTSLTSSGIATFTNSTSSTSSTTGAVRITGGVGIQRDLHVGGNVTASNLGWLASKNTIEWNEINDTPNTIPINALAPPKPMNGHTINITSSRYPALTGTYHASASTETTNREAWRAFNNDPGGGGLDSWLPTATYSSGNYTGSVSTTTTGGNSYPGEWIQIQFPIAIQMISFAFFHDEHSFMPRKYALLGSIDNGASWHLVSSAELSVRVVQWRVHPLDSPFVYTHFRFVVLSSWGGSGTRIRGMRFEVDIPGIVDTVAAKKIGLPPKPMTNNTTSIDATTLAWMGTYVASASSDNNVAFWSFSNSLWSGWISADNAANRYENDGWHTGSINQLIDGILYSGEWLRLQLPAPGRLISFTMYRSNHAREPREYTLFGVTDDLSWRPIRSGTMHQVTGTGEWFTYEARTTTRFNAFIFMVRRTWGDVRTRVLKIIYNVSL
jgi:hypothetical protein